MSKTIYACDFSEGHWNAADWRMVQSPRWDRVNDWIQEPDHIRNDGPETEAGETYTSMVLDRTLDVPFIVRATMSFDQRMAPLLVIGAEPTKLPSGRWQYGAHFELVLFDEGLNLWNHTVVDGKPAWTLAQKWRFDVQPQRRYELALGVQPGRLDVSLDGRSIGQNLLEGASDHVVAGLTACEGINRFFDFRVDTV